MRIVPSRPLIPTGTNGNAAGPVATPSTGAEAVSIVRQRQGPGATGPDHHHDGEEVLYLVAGEVAIHSGDDRCMLRPGDAAIIPGGAIHRVETTGTTPAEWLLIATSGVSFFTSDGTLVTPPWAA